MKSKSALILAVLGCITAAHAWLPVYEPFDARHLQREPCVTPNGGGCHRNYNGESEYLNGMATGAKGIRQTQSVTPAGLDYLT